MKHAAPSPKRRWFGLRAARPQPPKPDDVVDLREAPPLVLGDDPESVLARMGRLRDAGLITGAEYEAERRRLASGTST